MLCHHSFLLFSGAMDDTIIFFKNSFSISYYYFFPAVRHDRMRGGRNKFGPMYKRDRARKLQVMRTRTVSMPGGAGSLQNLYGNTTPASTSSISVGNQPIYTSQLHIKQEIQIPQVTSMTSSPDSSPSPVGLHPITMSNQNSNGVIGNQQVIAQQTDPSTGGIQWQITSSPPNTGSARVRIIIAFYGDKYIYT